MPDQPDYTSQVRASALRILAASLDQGPLFAPLVIAERSGGIIVTVSVSRDDWTVELTACERAVLSVLERATERWPTMRVLEEMNHSGHVFGESTIRHCLAHLVSLGYLKSSKKAPCGYWIPRSSTEAS